MDELDSGRTRFFSRCGSPNYVAPEVLDSHGYGKEVMPQNTFLCLIEHSYFHFHTDTDTNIHIHAITGTDTNEEIFTFTHTHGYGKEVMPQNTFLCLIEHSYLRVS